MSFLTISWSALFLGAPLEGNSGSARGEARAISVVVGVGAVLASASGHSRMTCVVTGAAQPAPTRWFLARTRFHHQGVT